MEVDGRFYRFFLVDAEDAVQSVPVAFPRLEPRLHHKQRTKYCQIQHKAQVWPGFISFSLFFQFLLFSTKY